MLGNYLADLLKLSRIRQFARLSQRNGKISRFYLLLNANLVKYIYETTTSLTQGNDETLRNATKSAF